MQQEPPRTSPPVGRALSAPSANDDSSGVQRAVSFVKQAMPVVQRLLPLLDGNFATAIANIFASRPHAQQPPPKVDLEPVQNQIADLQLQQQDLRGQMQEQNTSLRRVEDQLEMVREATDRNTREQQELIEDLKTIGSKVNFYALLLLVLLAGSVVLNIVLFLHIQRVLP